MIARTTIQKKLVRTSLSVFVPSILAATMAVVGLNVVLNGRSQSAALSRIEASLTAKGRLLASNNAQALEGMAEGNAFIQIMDLVGTTVKNDPDVVYGIFIPADTTSPCELSDESDSATAGGILSKMSKVKDRAGISWARSSRSLAMRRTGSGSGELLEFSSPVGNGDEPAGWILYKLSTRSMAEAIQATKNSFRWVLLGVVVMILAAGGSSLGFSLARFKSESKKISRPIRELALAAELIRGGDYRTPVSVVSDDEIGDLATTFETMRQTVQSYTEHLQELVAEKVRQVRDILDNVEQGLFVVNFDGSLSPEHSRAAPEILGVPELGNLQEALHLSPSQHVDFMSWLGLVQRTHTTMRWEKLTRIAPLQELEISTGDQEPRFVRLRYQRMYDKDRQVEKIMVLAQDETENRRIERIVANEKERHENEVKTIMGLVNNLPEVIREFMKDARSRIDNLEDLCRSMLDRSIAARECHPKPPLFVPSNEEISRIFRDLHTIKGNAGTYGFERLAKIAHQGEDLLESLKQPITVRTAETLRAILGKLDEMVVAYEEILATERKLMGCGLDGDVLVQVSERKLDHLRRLAVAIHAASHTMVDSDAVRTLAEACERIRDVPLSKLADKYRSMVQRMAERLGKHIRTEIVPKHFEVGPNFLAPLDEALVHLFRNSVDHGIESPEARLGAGKPEHGTIRLEVRTDEDRIEVTISDDGAGIDIESVAAKAVQSGLVSEVEMGSMDDEEKLQLVFQSGLSTSPCVTDVSGRGVGMSAVRDSIESLGGSVSISSETGKGTRIVLVIPQREG
jgi:signal transduction histidine kinase